jgi:pyruvate dehydrogenase E2 component (dihydrolipoamide acetyltransferase)
MVVGLDEGLIVPVIHDVDRLGLPALSATARTLKHKARQGGLSTRELTGGTFTVSNLGMFGVTSFIAVINPPESAILALGATIKRAVVGDDDQVVVRPVMTATLSVDHRIVDGIVAAGFLRALKEILEASTPLSLDLV